MGTASSTVSGNGGGRAPGLRRAAARILGGGRVPHAEVTALLLPMVRRAARTKRGPVALVSWLSRCPALADDPSTRAAALADGLARALLAPTGSPADTLAARASARQSANAPDAT